MSDGDGDEREENSTCGILKIINGWLLCFDLLTWPKMPFKVYTGRKWHILMAVMRGNRVGGN